MIACLFLGAVPTLSGSSLSNDQRVQFIQDFVEAMNDDDPVARRSFIEANYVNADSAAALDRWMGHFDRYSKMHGTLVIHDMNGDNPASLIANCHCDGRMAMSEWVELTVNMDSTVSSKFRTMSFGPGSDPTITYPDRPLTDDEIDSYLSKFVNRMAERDVFSGTVSITHDNRVVHSSAHGFANLRWSIPNNIDTKFNLGSMNKMFTSVAIAQLVSDGKMSYNDYIIDVMPEYPNKDVARKVTIHHLLTHTSGMGDYWDALFTREWTSVRSVKEFADLTINDTLEFEPGDHFRYSNSGAVILGYLIEHVTGMDYHDYIREHVTDPVGMKDTDCWAADEIVPNLALGYFYPGLDAEVRLSNIFEHAARGGPAGGGFSTVGDLQRFAKGLLDGKLIPLAYVDTITSGKVEAFPGHKYCYLFSESIDTGHRVVGHSGGAPGINANLDIYPELGYTVAAMSNYGTGASDICEYAGKLISHKREPTASTN